MSKQGPKPPDGYTLHRATAGDDGCSIDPPIPTRNFRMLLAWCPHTQAWIKPKWFHCEDSHWLASKDYGDEWIPPGDHYVVVAEFDMDPGDERYPDRPAGPLTWETYIGKGSSLDDVKRQRAVLGTNYGRTRIAKLEFTDE